LKIIVRSLENTDIVVLFRNFIPFHRYSLLREESERYDLKPPDAKRQRILHGALVRTIILD